MRRIIRRKRSGYALGFALCLVGLIVLLAVFGKAWSNVSASQNVLSALESYLWTEQFNVGFGISLRLMHLIMIGLAVLVLGILALVFSQQVFSVYAGENVLLQCPFCRNNWKASRGRGLAECPHCRQFVEPRVVKIGR